MRTLCLLLLCSIVLIKAAGQAGSLDSAFGNNGIQTTAFLASSTVIQGDKIIVAGSTTNPDNNNSEFALARYTADGNIDPSFGVNGLVTTDFNFGYDYGNAITLQGNKIVVAGHTGDNSDRRDFALARYTANGVLDSSFGVNGEVITYLSGYSSIQGIALQGSKIVVAGYNAGGPYFNFSLFDFALARYTADGILDSSFGENGIVAGGQGAKAIALQGDKIVVAGSTMADMYTPNIFALARYTADGRPDSSFGVNGKVKTDFSGDYNQTNAIAVQGDKTIVAGRSSIPVTGNYHFALARYTVNGTLDSSFGTNGLVTTDFNNSVEDNVNAIGLQGNKIIAAGYSNSNFALARYTADGVLDTSFGVNGKVITHVSDYSSIQDISVQQNRLYAVGSLYSSTGESYGVVAAYQLEAPQTPGPAISISDVTVCESQKQAVVTIHLSAPSTQVVQVHYQSHPITAHSVQDYYSVGWTLQFAPGCTTAKVKIPIVDDSICEPTEQFEVLLSNPQHATIKDSIGIITIVDDDCNLVANQHSTAWQQSTSLNLTASPNPSADGFTIRLHSSDLKQPVSIRVYDISGRLLEQRGNISVGQVLHLGDRYKPGTYIIEAAQGGRSVQTKVIRTGK